MDAYGSDGLILAGKPVDYMGIPGKLNMKFIKAIAEGG